MIRLSFEVRGWDRWDRDYAEARRGADREFRRVVSKGALNVKLDWARRWAALGRHLPHIGRSISYDVRSSGSVHTAEIGPDKTRAQGPLGTIIEDANGAARNRATHAGNRAGRAEESKFVRAAGDAAVEAAGG